MAHQLPCSTSSSMLPCASLPNPCVLHSPSQHHAASRPLAPAHCFLPILLSVLCFPRLIFGSFLTNWLQWSQPEEKPLQAVGLITPQQRLLLLYSRHVFWTECTNVGSLWSRSCPLEFQLSHALGDSAFPKAKSLILLQVPSFFYCNRTP